MSAAAGETKDYGEIHMLLDLYRRAARPLKYPNSLLRQCSIDWGWQND